MVADSSIIVRMPERLEPDYTLLNVVGGAMLEESPVGVAVTAAPRRCARGRERDLLFVSLGLRGSVIGANDHEKLMERAAATYFGQTGSVTAAARLAVMAANKLLLETNLRTGVPVQGGLTLAVLRGDDFYATQSGPGVSIIARGIGLQRFPASLSRPLGVSDTLDIQYFHTALEVGDYLALSPNAAWPEAGLAGLGGLSTLSSVIERLKATAGGDFVGIAVRLEPEGVGAAAQTPLSAAAMRQASAPVARPAPAAPLPDLSSLAKHDEPALPPRNGLHADAVDVDEAPAMPVEPVRYSAPAATLSEPPIGPEDDDRTADLTDEALEDAARPNLRERVGALRETLTPVRGGVLHGLRSFGRAIGVTLTESARGLNRLTARVLPEGILQRDGMLAVPSSVMLAAAVVIPLIVVGLAALIYVQIGRQEQYASALRQAQFEIARAQAAADPAAARPHWAAAVEFTEIAEQMRPGQTEVAEVRLQAERQLDQIDLVTRLVLSPLLPSGVGPNARLSRLMLLGNDLYALDADGNRIVRLTPSTAGGYFLDTAFRCTGGQIGGIQVGTLVDAFLLPGPIDLGARPGDPPAPDAIVGLDETGNLLYCFANRDPIAIALAAPDTGWARPIAAELFGDRLYVLDAGRNQVWQFDANGGAFVTAPVGYFSQTIYDLSNTLTFTIANGELLLLRDDGTVTDCVRLLPAAPPDCVVTAPFTDSRLNRGVTPRLTDLVRPGRLVYDAPPEPSVLLIDADDQAIFQLSLQLALVRKYKPAQALAGPIYAAVIGPAERLYISAGNNVYVAERP